MTLNADGVHHAATDGYTKGADTYVKGRPGYPPELADWLTNHLHSMGCAAGCSRQRLRRRYAALLYGRMAPRVSIRRLHAA